jgi:hypothetical protein
MATRQWRVARKWVLFWAILISIAAGAVTYNVGHYGGHFFFFRGNGTGTTDAGPTDQQELAIDKNPNLTVDNAGNLVARKSSVRPHLETRQPVERAVSPPTANPNSMPTLSEGSTGNPVGTAQQWLNVHGANIPVDGSFGPETESAVVVFQQTDHIAVTGVVGPVTWKALEIAP